MQEERGRTKTQTIKERAVYVYLPSHHMVKDWKEKAERAGVSVSKFVIEHVQNSLGQEEGGEAYAPRVELLKRLREQEGETARLTEENRVLKLALERLDDELKHYRAQPFLEESFEGVRSYWKELVEALRTRHFIGTDELLELLRVDPENTELVKAVSKQLENLEAYGLVEETRRGWTWRA